MEKLEVHNSAGLCPHKTENCPPQTNILTTNIWPSGFKLIQHDTGTVNPNDGAINKILKKVFYMIPIRNSGSRLAVKVSLKSMEWGCPTE